MTFVDGIANLAKVKPFEGGNDQQRNKLNTHGDAINAMIDAAKNDPQNAEKAVEGMNRQNFQFWVNGVLVSGEMLVQPVEIMA